MTDQELVQSQLRALNEKHEALTRNPRIKKYLQVIGEHVKSEQGRDLTIREKKNIAQCLRNAVEDTALKANKRLFEATTEDNISFLGVQRCVA